jgi:cardiolipin synthase (CMP-forming)
LKNISNILTLIRLMLVPAFPLVFFSSHPQSRLIALGIFVTAGITDFLDGYIARRFDLTSQLGTVLDPLADKLMLLAVLLSLWVNGTLPSWIFLILLLKESFMITAGSYLYFKRSKFVIPSNLYGKAATALLFLAIPLRILMPENPLSSLLIFASLGLMAAAITAYYRYYSHHKDAWPQ